VADELLPEDFLNVRRDANVIYFFEECTEKSILLLRMGLMNIKQERYPCAVIVINSFGGCLHCMYDFIKGLGIPVITCVEGYCCSSATLIFLAGTKRFISPSSLFLIHSVRGYTEQNEIQKEGSSMEEAENYKKMNDTFLRVAYKKETKVPQKLLNEMLSHREMFLDASECLEYKIAHQIGVYAGD
jgi:ATP-dependent protease ClpP protease subunit